MSKKVKVKLIGENGNALNLLGLAKQAMQRAGVPEETIKEMSTKALSGDYNNLLVTIGEYCEIE